MFARVEAHRRRWTAGRSPGTRTGPRASCANARAHTVGMADQTAQTHSRAHAHVQSPAHTLRTRACTHATHTHSCNTRTHETLPSHTHTRRRCRSRTRDAVRSSLNFFFRSSFRNRALLWWIVDCAPCRRARTQQAVCNAHWPARPTARPSQGSHRAVDTQTRGPGRSAQTQPAKSASARAGTGRR